MKKVNIKNYYEFTDLKTFGLTSVLCSLRKNFKMYRKIARQIYRSKPSLFIAVAYPGINLLLCRYAKKIGAKVIFLLPPQIWAWGDFRKYFIRKWVDFAISVFPFEYQYYIKRNINVYLWHNPLFEELKKFKRTDYTTRIGFMPGSRRSEIRRNLSVIREIITRLVQKSRIEPDYIREFCLIIQPDNANEFEFRGLTRDFPFIKMIMTDRYQAMCNCDLLITCSGTASLEAAIMGVQQIFFNRPGFLDYHLFRRLIKVREYNLVNLYYGKKVVPSFVSHSKKFLAREIMLELEHILRT